MLSPGPADRRFYWFAWMILAPTFHLLFRMRVVGRENVPIDGAVVLACNHVANIDPVFLGVASPRQARFMAKSELWSFRPLARLVEALGAFPVRRGEADRDAIRSAVSYLDQRAMVGIFPEGRRQKSGRLGTPLPGFALLALRAGVKTVPVAMTGTNQILRGGVPRFPKVTVTFGPPLDVSVDGIPRGERHAEIGRRLMTSLAEMLGQEWEPERADPSGKERR
ncbi:MAG: lysophospholipid acyltransferase family protein [Thermoleophilia bacterium]